MRPDVPEIKNIQIWPQMVYILNGETSLYINKTKRRPLPKSGETHSCARELVFADQPPRKDEFKQTYPTFCHLNYKFTLFKKHRRRTRSGGEFLPEGSRSPSLAPRSPSWHLKQTSNETLFGVHKKIFPAMLPRISTRLIPKMNVRKEATILTAQPTALSVPTG
jgi:hypothetical protein